jgi:hypothetical protein
MSLPYTDSVKFSGCEALCAKSAPNFSSLCESTGSSLDRELRGEPVSFSYRHHY